MQFKLISDEKSNLYIILLYILYYYIIYILYYILYICILYIIYHISCILHDGFWILSWKCSLFPCPFSSFNGQSSRCDQVLNEWTSKRRGVTAGWKKMRRTSFFGSEEGRPMSRFPGWSSQLWKSLWCVQCWRFGLPQKLGFTRTWSFLSLMRLGLGLCAPLAILVFVLQAPVCQFASLPHGV